MRPFMKIKKAKLVQDNGFRKAITELAIEIAKSTNPVSGTMEQFYNQFCYFTNSLGLPLLKASFHFRAFIVL